MESGPTTYQNAETEKTAVPEGISDEGKKGIEKRGRSSLLRKLKEEKELLQAQNEQLKDQYLRALAEFDNFRKRKQSEAIDASFRTRRAILGQLLPILDDMERLLNQSNENQESIITGARLIAEKLRRSMEETGLKKIPSKGEKFNPELHEAVLSMETKEGEEAEVILEVVEEGYFLEDQVLRHAKVIVSK
jgi:molecular chaperone GrpE